MIEQDLQQILEVPPLSLQEILDARERRAATQQEMLCNAGTLISFTLNIAGAIKSAPLFSIAFEEGKHRILTQLRFEQAKILRSVERHDRTGDELYLLTDLDLVTTKRRMVEIEEGFALGRLFDIDVLAKDVPKISRQQLGLPPRRCLLCGEMAAACARSRRHSVQQLLRRTVELIDGYRIEEWADKVAGLACRALLYEVHVAPKPGLVDRENSGAHRDMDEFTFLSSASALYPYFRDCATKGALYREKPKELFLLLRMDGKLAEERMLLATGGINTHKGAIFSMGIFCAVLGSFIGQPFDLCVFAQRCKILCEDLLRDFEGLDKKDQLTHGERLYLHYQVTGIRGEAAAGFPSVLQIALPALRQAVGEGKSLNDAALFALLQLIAKVQDTNILIRSDLDTLHWAQEQAANTLALGPTAERLRQLDQRFTEKRISPGGCADLLALSLLLYFFTA